MNIGIVGSRRRRAKEAVCTLVEDLGVDIIETELTIVSGGCKGVDTWAEEHAKILDIPIIIHKPDLKNIKDKADMVSRYYARNKKIAKDSDILYAFVASDRKGGTENTISWMVRLGKGDKVILK